MKHAVLFAAMFFAAGATAAPAPVQDLAGGSNDDRISRLERIIKAKQQTEFEAQQRLDTLQREVLDLRGITEQQDYQISQMLQRQRQLYEEIANLSASAAATTVTVAENNAASAGPSSLGETASYEQAVNLVLKERKYDEAIPAFSNFIKQYPDSTYAANANYWLGQLLFNKGTFTEAKQAFDAVVTKYPNSNKRGDSLVKLGMIAEKEGDKATATTFYNRVLKEYTNSASARLAQQQLSAL
ncbi:tol-pal system protein YbgF [Shewanella sp. UCD-KL21]|uniref:tol-pal system protein YbgF n=1 Tax=Shewanella sp. UCD-KL21 TaxID=1917164 RepID=UPI000970ED52|nr:tol-pal system protein YbgF [Shewanella sp. UCD-KL21]